ncbi:hypothetical protein, partial [Nucisporomicrobium flavum]|uniref:hypothetical protein n=1 Tax=Nucisporomicrobium flavum TaxID=2785915 RepID=UPI001F27DBA7
PRGLRYEVLAWSQNQIPETSSVIDHRHAATSDLGGAYETRLRGFSPREPAAGPPPASAHEVEEPVALGAAEQPVGTPRIRRQPQKMPRSTLPGAARRCMKNDTDAGFDDFTDLYVEMRRQPADDLITPSPNDRSR